MLRFHIVFLLIIFSGLSLYGKEPILVGASLSDTGNYRETSEMIHNAYRLWEEEINGSGGLLGREVQLIVLDDQSSSENSRKNYKALIEKYHVDLVLSPYGTPNTLAASEVTEQHKMVMIACGASGTEIWQRGHRYIFGMYALADRYFIGFLDLLAREGMDTVAIINERNPFNIDAADGAAEWARRFGIRLTGRYEFDPEIANLKSILQEVRAGNPDGIIVCTYPNAGYEILDIMTVTGYKPEALAMTIIPIHPGFAEKAGPISNGIFAPSQWEPIERIPFPGSNQFIRDFFQLTGQMPSYHATSAYASCKLIERAVRQTGTLDHDLIREIILSLDTVTVLGRFKVDHTGKQIGHNSILIQWQKGQKEIVYPLQMKTADPIFPDG